MICAGIIIFNPDINILKKNIDSIIKQVNFLVVVDNGSDNIAQIKILMRNYKYIKIICNNENLGIAAALNQALAESEVKGYKWFISLDQDSICPNDFVENISAYIDIEDRIGIIAPTIVDRDIGIIGHSIQSAYAEVRTCITSGSCTNISAWRVISGYDEKMFIDSVDFEFCYRMRRAGFKVIQLRDIKLSHKIGDTQYKRFIFWNIKVSGHSAFRKFYIAKNNIYYPKKHRLYFHLFRANIRNVTMILIVILYEENKVKKLQAIIKGWLKGWIDV